MFYESRILGFVRFYSLKIIISRNGHPHLIRDSLQLSTVFLDSSTSLKLNFMELTSRVKNRCYGDLLQDSSGNNVCNYLKPLVDATFNEALPCRHLWGPSLHP